jgi:hypothetical protein
MPRNGFSMASGRPCAPGGPPEPTENGSSQRGSLGASGEAQDRGVAEARWRGSSLRTDTWCGQSNNDRGFSGFCEAD